MNLGSKDVSQDFPNSGKIYLNNASVSLMPLESINAMQDFLISYNSVGPDSINSEHFITEKLRNARKIISKIIKCQPDEIVLTQSTTDGINIVANGLSFDKNSNIVIRGLSHEHHANYYPWLRLKNKTQIRSLAIDQNGFFELSELELLLDDDTVLIALSHALYNTGAILPLEKISHMISEKTMFFVDTAQTVGCIGDYDFSKINCNFMSFNGSKWLCGPMGTGLFYCARNSSKQLEPMAIGGESAILYDDEKLAYKELPDKFQTGFRNYVGIVGMEASARYLLDFGLDNIRKKNLYLSSMLFEELSKIPQITLYGPEEHKDRTSIVSFNHKNYEASEVVNLLEKQGIILAVREISELKVVRASPHFFNTDYEIQRVIDTIKKL